MNELMGLLIAMAPVVTALVWRNAYDRRAASADAVRAHITSAVNRKLGGESLVAVRVEPALGWRLGRVHLSAPRSYDDLIPQVSGAVLREMPINYELVVHAASTIGR
jgi:hypothetical protein